MKNSIYPCFILKNQVSEAAAFYIDTFGEGRIANTSPWVIQIELSGQKFMLLNEGPPSLPNPSISFMVISEAADETEKYWNKLIEGGSSLMQLDVYPWSTKYGWVRDKYGVSWQLYTGSRSDTPQKFCPSLMFTGINAGKASEAISLYTSLFPNSKTVGVMNYSKEDGDNPEFIKHAQFILNDSIVMAMDSSLDHGFSFNDAISLVVECGSQEEIDGYWEALIADGGQEVACGWLTDKYGVRWQIIPKNLDRLMNEPERAQRVMSKVMQMKKLIIADMENA